MKVGSLVVCVDAYHPTLTLNKVYEVEGIHTCCTTWILVGVPKSSPNESERCPYCMSFGPPIGQCGYESDAFRELMPPLETEAIREENVVQPLELEPA